MNAMRLAQTLASNPFFQFAKLGTVNKNSEEHLRLGFDSFLKITLVRCMLVPCSQWHKPMHTQTWCMPLSNTTPVGKLLPTPARFFINDPPKDLCGSTLLRPPWIGKKELRTRSAL